MKELILKLAEYIKQDIISEKEIKGALIKALDIETDLKLIQRFDFNSEFNGEFIEYDRIYSSDGMYIESEDIDKLLKNLKEIE